MKGPILLVIAILSAFARCVAQTHEVSPLIKEVDGNVGIGLGSTAPVYKLDVNGPILARGIFESSIDGSGNGIGGAISLTHSGKNNPNVARTWTIFNMGGNSYTNSLQFWAYDQTGCNGGLCNQRVVFMDNGNVGIGVDNPQARLAVNGGIVATKIKVSQSLAWPDYVFASGYQLPSLYELEQYINTHQHLPDVPSASEVAANGIDLGDNQAVLLRKIEELTLYVIELKKEMDAMKQQAASKR